MNHLNRIYCLPQTLYLAKNINIKGIKLLIVQEHEHVNMGNQGQQPEQNELMLLLRKNEKACKLNDLQEFSG